MSSKLVLVVVFQSQRYFSGLYLASWQCTGVEANVGWNRCGIERLWSRLNWLKLDWRDMMYQKVGLKTLKSLFLVMVEDSWMRSSQLQIQRLKMPTLLEKLGAFAHCVDACMKIFDIIKTLDGMHQKIWQKNPCNMENFVGFRVTFKKITPGINFWLIGRIKLSFCFYEFYRKSLIRRRNILWALFCWRV